MTLFIIISLILLIIAYLGSNRLSKSSNSMYETKKKHTVVLSIEKTVCLLLLFFFWLLTAFRSINIGNDTRNYISVFNSIARQGILPTFYMEIGYQYINLIISKIFGSDPHVFLIVCATISYLGISIYIIKKSKNYYLSVCIAFCLLFSCYTNTIRQGLGMILGIVAYQLILKKKIVPAVVVILFAMSIHYSAIVLFALFLYRFVPKKYSTVLIISGLLLALSVSGALNAILYQLVPRGQAYFLSERVGSGFLALSYELIRDLIFCFFAYKSCKGEVFNIEKQRRLSLFVASALISCISFNMNLISRANGFFLILMIVELPNVFHDLDSRSRKWCAWGTCAVMIIYFVLVQMIRPEWNHLIPYEFWRN